jgi:hypothetical protein
MASRFTACLLALLIIACTTTSAQTRRPTKNEVLSLLDKVDENLARFETTTDQINFNRWDKPYTVVSGATRDLDAARKRIADVRVTIILCRQASFVPSTVLFDIFDVMMRATDTAGLLAMDESDPTVSKQLFDVASSGTRIGVELRELTRRQLESQEADLAQCHSK